MYNSINSEFANKYLIENYIKKGFYPNPDLVLNHLGKNYEIYRDMKNDSHIWSCIQSRKSGTLSLEHFLEPNQAEPPIVSLIENVINNLDMYKLQNDILEAIFFGFQALEIIWKYTKFEGKYYIIPEKIIPSYHEKFKFDDIGNLYIKLNYNQTEKVPEYKYLLARNESGVFNPYGEPVLSKCYWYVTFKNGATRYWINYAEKYGSPMLLAQFQRGASQDEAEQLADSLAEMSQDAVIVMPSDYKVDISEPNRAASIELFRELIKYCNNEISKAILSQTLTTEIEAGSYAAAEVHYRIRKEIIKTDSMLIRKVINKLIEYIIVVNNLGNNYPKFNHIINDADNNTRIERDIKLHNAGIKLSNDYWMRTYGLRQEDIKNINE